MYLIDNLIESNFRDIRLKEPLFYFIFFPFKAKIEQILCENGILSSKFLDFVGFFLCFGEAASNPSQIFNRPTQPCKVEKLNRTTTTKII